MNNSCAVLHRLATRHPSLQLSDLTRQSDERQSVASTFVATNQQALLQRLSIYSEGYFGRIAGAMRKGFEVTALALGQEAFDECVWRYLRKYPSSQPNLRWVGCHFPAFLKQSSAEEQFEWHGKPWLAELAALEWAHSLAFDAASIAPVLFSDLRAVPPEDWGSVFLAWHPTVQRVNTHHELLSLLEGSTDWDLPQRISQHVLIWRVGLNVVHQPLSSGDTALFDALKHGLSIAEFCCKVAESRQLEEQQAAVEAGCLLNRWMSDHCLVRIAPS